MKDDKMEEQQGNSIVPLIFDFVSCLKMKLKNATFHKFQTHKERPTLTTQRSRKGTDY